MTVSLWKRMNGTARLEPASDRGSGGLLGQGEHLWGGQHRHLPAAEAAAVSASITVSPKAASRPGASVMGQPYAAPPPPGGPRSHNRTEAGSAVGLPGLAPGTSSLSGTSAGCVHTARV